MFEPVKVDADAGAVEDDRFPAFVITRNGQEETYTVPREISGATAIEALTVYVNRGEPAMVLWLAEHALGAEGMQAVLTCEQLTLGQAKDLVTKIGQHYTGVVKELGKQ